MYRILCEFHPNVAVFAPPGQPPKLGAWRVLDCYIPINPVSETVQSLPDVRVLALWSVRRRQRNSWCSPRKILQEWLDAKAPECTVYPTLRETWA